MDLHKVEGRAVLKALAERADVLVENFRPGVMEAWGLGPQVSISLLNSLGRVTTMPSRHRKRQPDITAGIMQHLMYMTAQREYVPVVHAWPGACHSWDTERATSAHVTPQ